jgi:chromosome segregation ATPase
VTLRLGPTDEVFLAVGQVVHFGQVIARKDISVQAERLRNDCVRDLEALQRRLADVRAHLQAAREDLRLAATERTRLQAGMARLVDPPLLTKEAARGRNALQAHENRVGEIVQRINLLVHEERQVEDQIHAREAQLSADLQLLARQAEVRAGFSGRITRLDREASGDSAIYEVYYRGGE